MTIQSIVHFGTSLIFGALAWLLWWQAIPPLLARRGRIPAMGPWLLGMALALFSALKLELALDNVPVRMTLLMADACLAGTALLELARTRRIGPFRWGKCPHEVEAER